MEKDYRFNLEEMAGAIGDYGTLLPLIVGVVAITNIQLAPVLFFFGIAYIITGLYYKLPMPVEPMKAIGAIAIAGGLTASEIAGAGIGMGLVLLILGLTGGMSLVKRYIPQSIIRGIQFGLSLVLLKTALSFVLSDILAGVISVAIVIAFSVLPLLDVSSLVIFVFGLGIGMYNYGLPPITLFTIPELTLPSLAELWSGFVYGTIPQIPLTLGNAALATSLLITDLLKRDVPEDKLVVSMGIMCVISSPFGGFPMCHGAGGLAAQYRFGARTGGSNIISGGILLIVAFFFASQDLITLIPYGVLGALLFFSSLQMAKSALKTDNIVFTILTGTIAFFTNISIAFVIALTTYYIVKWFKSNNVLSNK